MNIGHYSIEFTELVLNHAQHHNFICSPHQLPLFSTVMGIRQIWITLLFSSFAYGQFGEVKVVFDNRLLKVHHQQNILPLKQDIARFIKMTRWDEDYSDL